MPIINQIIELKQQGYNSEQIIQYLGEQGFSPLEISQALDQAEIKAAVSQPPEFQPPEISQSQMQPSLAEQEMPEPSARSAKFSQAEEAPPAEEYAYPAPQAYPQPQAYQQEYQYPEYQPAAPETITEIAEQIVEEKTGKIKKQVNEILLFKETSERRIRDMDERLKKIENIIDNLQAAILGKVGSYGQNLEDVKKEMRMIQDSFSKVLNPLISKVRENDRGMNIKNQQASQLSNQENKSASQMKQQIKQQPRKPERRSNDSDGFENYLRQ